MVTKWPFPRFLPVVPSEPPWEGTPAGEPDDGGSRGCEVVPGPGEAAVSRAPPRRPSHRFHRRQAGALARTRSLCCSRSRRRLSLAARCSSSSRCRASCSSRASGSSLLPGSGHAAFEDLGPLGPLCSQSAPGSLGWGSCAPEAGIPPPGPRSTGGAGGIAAGGGAHAPSWMATACVSWVLPPRGPGIPDSTRWRISFPGDLQRSLEWP